MMQALFTLDGFTDVEPAPVVREIASIVMDALRNPDKPRPAGEVILGEMMRQCVHTHHKSVVLSTADLTVSFFGRCWTRVSYTATPQARKHFLATMEGLLNAFVAQAEDRGNNTIRSVGATSSCAGKRSAWAPRTSSGSCICPSLTRRIITPSCVSSSASLQT